MTIVCIDLLVVLLVAIAWTTAIDREDLRRARRNAPITVAPRLPMARVAIPAAWRKRWRS